MAKTKIPWATDVWNPVIGCSKVSAGCANCYAAALHNKRHEAYTHGAKLPAQYAKPFSEIQLLFDRLEEPAHWKKPRRVFVDSMGDLFHEKLDFAHILTIFYRMATYDRHIYIVLTKRPKRMLKFFDFWQEHINLCKANGYAFFRPPLRNVWLGVSVEDNNQLHRIDDLLKTPAAVRFVSVEPMLGPVDIRRWTWPLVWQWDAKYETPEKAMAAGAYAEEKPQGLVSADARFIDWVICGCESGPGARPFEMDWARSLRDQCQAAGVPFFFKQGMIDGKLVHMPALDGQVWAQYPAGKGGGER